MDFIKEFFEHITWQQTLFAVALSSVVALIVDYFLRPYFAWRKHKLGLLSSLKWTVGFSNFKNVNRGDIRLGPNDLVRLKNELSRACNAAEELESIRPDSALISRVRAACQSTLENVKNNNLKKFRDINQTKLRSLHSEAKKLNYLWGKK